MRSQSIVAAILAVFTAASLIFAAIAPAQAGGWHRNRGWGEVQAVDHHIYYPRYRQSYHYHPYTDPYAYRYEPRGYYPYYNSHYWKPAWVMRHRPRYVFVPPPYYQAWGYPKRHYRHREWHRRHHGHIRKHRW